MDRRESSERRLTQWASIACAAGPTVSDSSVLWKFTRKYLNLDYFILGPDLAGTKAIQEKNKTKQK